MDKKLQYNKMKNKRGMSMIVTAVILIGLVMVAAVIVWVVVRNIIQDQLESVESCFGIYDKVTINNRYTCYDNSVPTDNKTHFSISISDIEVDSVIVSISGAGATNSYTLTNQGQTITNLANYPDDNPGTDLIIVPGKNSRLTYISDGTFM